MNKSDTLDLHQLIEKHVLTLKIEGQHLIDALDHEPPDYQAAREWAHLLKGASASLGFKELMVFAAELEDESREMLEDCAHVLNQESLQALRPYLKTLQPSDSELYKKACNE